MLQMPRWCLVLLSLVFASLIGSSPARAKDGIVEILGVVQVAPAAGLIGSWTIAGRAVRSDAATVIKQELGAIGVGATVQVKGTDQPDGSVLATIMEVKQGVPTGGGGGANDGEVLGTIESLPASGLLGSWRVAGRTVIVVSTTRLQQELGGFRIGATVQVHGLADAAGVITASAIEVKAGGAPGAVPPPVSMDVEITGAITALPAGLIGEWQVSGRFVRVTAATVLNAEHGAFVLGASVQVHGRPDSLGAVNATRIERVAGNGAAVPALMFWGVIDALPAASTMPVGLWKVAGKLVSVSASTTIRQNDAPLALGAIVEVQGWQQPDGVIEASEIETRTVLGAVPGQGERAIEFANDKLGHYFITAFPAEIALLDGGAFNSAWRRTGESFRVGGASASVCRFYGLPPQGPDSHFFTVDTAECAQVMSKYAAWTFEAHAFSITPASNGTCAAGLVPVRRFYNNPAQGSDMNHRYVVSAAAANETRGRGWIEEGVVMCAQP